MKEEGRRKKEEGRRKKEEGRRKKEEGTGKMPVPQSINLLVEQASCLFQIVIPYRNSTADRNLCQFRLRATTSKGIFKKTLFTFY
ncbi:MULTISPECIES: hypothetical protein [unclassified Microcoleus]|uniref:hypothetical protein n=1 Tax=unclassified Microcoleus TaxID=2642155 RepID=UPI002FD53595